MMAELCVADSSVGPSMIRMLATFLPAGGCWETVWVEKVRMLTQTVIATDRSLLILKTRRHRGVTSWCYFSSGSFHLRLLFSIRSERTGGENSVTVTGKSP